MSVFCGLQVWLLSRCGPHPLQGENPGSLVYNKVRFPPPSPPPQDTSRQTPPLSGSQLQPTPPREKVQPPPLHKHSGYLRLPPPPRHPPGTVSTHPSTHLRGSERSPAPAADSSAPPCGPRASTRAHSPPRVQPGAPLASPSPRSQAQLLRQPSVLPPTSAD